MTADPTNEPSGEILAASDSAAATDGYSNALILLPLTISTCGFDEKNGVDLRQHVATRHRRAAARQQAEIDQMKAKLSNLKE